jgi:nicotinamidase/pyrazinamidase
VFCLAGRISLGSGLLQVEDGAYYDRIDGSKEGGRMISKDHFKSNDAMIVVDVQVDFCPGGALVVTHGDRIVPILNEWLQAARQAAVPVFASRDWHPLEHISFSAAGGQWPPHCIQDTPGAAFHPQLKLPENAIVVTKGVRFDHDQNSAFDETGLAVYLKNRGIQRIWIAGLALDVCVLATAMDARHEGFEVVLLAEATRPVNPQDGAEAISKMQRDGVVVFGAGKRADEVSDTEGDQCLKAPEWAEHQRFSDDDMGCDDGRAG